MRLNREKERVRELEEREKRALERECHETLMLTPTWIADQHSNNTYISEAFLEETGWARRQLLGQGWQRCIAPEDLPKTMEAYLYSVEHRARFESMYCLRMNTGRRMRVQVVTAPRYNESGEFSGVSGVVFRLD